MVADILRRGTWPCFGSRSQSVLQERVAGISQGVTDLHPRAVRAQCDEKRVKQRVSVRPQ